MNLIRLKLARIALSLAMTALRGVTERKQIIRSLHDSMALARGLL